MNIETLCLHSIDKRNEYGCLTTPIYQTSTFVHEGVEDTSQYSYSRLANPTRSHLENLVARLENGEKAYAFSSGMAAISTAIKLIKPPAHIIASDDLYGGSIRLFSNDALSYGYEFDFIDTSDLELVKSKIKDNTKAIYIETPSNPLMHVSDIQAISDIAKKNDLLFFVDNTFLTPYYQRPLDLGADIVVHSGTKFLGGHNDALAGFVVVKDKAIDERLAYLYKTVGACLAPFDSFLIERGIKTLPIRMDRISQNAKAVAQWLRNNPNVNKVYYVGFEDNKDYEISKKQSTGFGGMISFEVKKSAYVSQILRNVKVFQYAESLGGVESLITFPKKQTHADVPKEILEAKGINDRFLRISVGIENEQDLIEDLEQAFKDEV